MRLLIGFNGHGQRNRPTTGVGKLLLRVKHASIGNETWLFAWRHNTRTLASWIKCARPGDSISIVGFSYGGYSAVLLCRELQRLGVRVNHLYLIDAVARPWRRVGSLRSLIDHYWWISVPRNVWQVTSWRQQINYPRGHKIVCESRATTHNQYTLNVPHSQADDNDQVHATILSDFS